MLRVRRALVVSTIVGYGLAGLIVLLSAIAPANAASTATIAPAAAARPSFANEDIHDIRGPYHIPPSWLWLAWVAGGLALVGLGYGVWRWRHRRVARAKLPYEIALERLEEARRLMRSERACAFSIAVSEVVRDYIEKSFPVRAAHRTTEEFLRDLAVRPDSSLVAHQAVLADFMWHCDLAKFARWILSMPQMEAMLQSASDFVWVTGTTAAGVSRTLSVDKPSAPHALVKPLGTLASSSATRNHAASSATALKPQRL
ncbi:MAG TPA: DUF4381 family protein [Candidatus Acidoferrales bacterium]|nr:DUF4381 family protein [Candidatus Acidoferrales bacterium]